MSNHNIANTIDNILNQSEKTSISIGKVIGHYLSQGQLIALRECVEHLRVLESAAALTTSTAVVSDHEEEYLVHAQRATVAKAIRAKQAAVTSASGADRPTLNLELGKLLSERAKLDKLIKKFGDASV